MLDRNAQFQYIEEEVADDYLGSFKVAEFKNKAVEVEAEDSDDNYFFKNL